MAKMLESYGLGFLEEDEETLMGFVGYVVSEGKAFSSYYGAPYLYMPMGTVEFWAGTAKDEEGKLTVSGFHTHAGGKNVWDMLCSEFDLTPKDWTKNERVLMLRSCTESGGMLPVDIINADVLPSFLEGERLTLQIVAPCLTVNYYATEKDYDDAQPQDKHGRKWMIADGSLIPLSFLSNHAVDNYEKGKEYHDDAYVHFRARVKELYHGVFELKETRENAFIRCVADTIHGTIEFHHSIDQVPEEMRKNIKIGSVISGVCFLSADAAINEYEHGIVKDFDHDLQLLRYTLQKGEAERLRSVLSENSVYHTETDGESYLGAAEIIRQFEYVAENHEGKYFAHMAEITETDGEDLEFPTGTKCIVLAADSKDHYESIVFMTTDEDGNIARIEVSTDSRYHFKVIPPERVRTPLDDLEPPESVIEPILTRARFHGLIDEETEFSDITHDSDYSSHADNAERMLDALRTDSKTDDRQAIGNVFAYLFAKAAETTVNENRENPTYETRLTASYSPADAIQGKLKTTLDPEMHSKLENIMELAAQFQKDLFFFMEVTDKSEDAFDDLFIQTAVAAQRIGQLYAEQELIASEGGES